MVLSVNVDESRFTQKCDSCSSERSVNFSELNKSSEKKILSVPQCSCGALEFLIYNQGNKDHDVLVARIFASI